MCFLVSAYLSVSYMLFINFNKTCHKFKQNKNKKERIDMVIKMTNEVQQVMLVQVRQYSCGGAAGEAIQL